jgi:hypothetical protein
MRRVLWISFALALLANCATASDLSDAAASYRRHRDFPSLQTVVRHLTKGMNRRSVEKLLGKADYSPTDGVCYYSSDKMAFSNEAQREIIMGLIVEYRDDSGKITGRLESWKLGPIGE